MDGQTLAFLRRAFERYYRESRVPPPPRFSRREFAFITFGSTSMIRHIGFGSARELRSFILEKVPRNAYYSSAYYERPSAPEMSNKGWMGADLVFDLDADHMGRSGTWEELLNEVRRQVVMLVNDFLLGDLGIEEKFLRVVFSGGRGFHVHVSDTRFLALGSDERREIVLYVKGKEMDPDRLLREGKLPSPSDPGWRGRVGRALSRILLAGAHGEELPGADPRYWARLRSWLSEEVQVEAEGTVLRGRRGEVFNELLIRGADSSLLGRRAPRLIEMAISLASSEEGVIAADEPVTTDIHRLIRLPNTLHGKTGFVVKPLRVEELEDFDPLSDAIAETFRRGEVRVRGLRPFSLRVGDLVASVREGEEVVYPTYAAILLLGMGVAEVTGSSF